MHKKQLLLVTLLISTQVTLSAAKATKAATNPGVRRATVAVISYVTGAATGITVGTIYGTEIQAEISSSAKIIQDACNQNLAQAKEFKNQAVLATIKALEKHVKTSPIATPISAPVIIDNNPANSAVIEEENVETVAETQETSQTTQE